MHINDHEIASLCIVKHRRIWPSKSTVWVNIFHSCENYLFIMPCSSSIKIFSFISMENSLHSKTAHVQITDSCFVSLITLAILEIYHPKINRYLFNFNCEGQALFSYYPFFSDQVSQQPVNKQICPFIFILPQWKSNSLVWGCLKGISPR